MLVYKRLEIGRGSLPMATGEPQKASPPRPRHKNQTESVNNLKRRKVERPQGRGEGEHAQEAYHTQKGGAHRPPSNP